MGSTSDLKIVEAAGVSFSPDRSGAHVDKERGDIENLSNDYVVDRALEKRLLWKFDIHILPMLAMMYLFKYVSFMRS